MATESDIPFLNFVQVASSRPEIYTANGTLAEIYALLIGYDVAQKSRYEVWENSVPLTLQWLHDNARNPRNVVEEMLSKHGSDKAALRAIYEYASTLPSQPDADSA